MFRHVERFLSQAQQARLEWLADSQPEAKVVGWSERMAGPIVRYADGGLHTLSERGRLMRTSIGDRSRLAA